MSQFELILGTRLALELKGSIPSKMLFESILNNHMKKVYFGKLCMIIIKSFRWNIEIKRSPRWFPYHETER